MSGRIHNYHYASDDSIVRKTYGVDRALTFVLSNAYNAGGIVGSEYNGIVVLDDDNGEVVLDRHFEGRSLDVQKKELARLCAADWKDLCAFVNTHPRTRNVQAHDLVPGSKPERGDLVAQARAGRSVDLSHGPDIRTPGMVEMDADEACPYALPLRTRAEITAFLTSHPMHDTGNGYGCALAWDVKVHSFDMSGKGGESEGEESKVDGRLDPLWDAYLQDDEGDSVFGEACEDALRQYVEGEYTTYPGDDGGRYEFRTEGRSGGWLVLSKYEGKNVEFKDAPGLRDWVLSLSDENVANLYKLVASIDHDTDDPGKEMAHQYGFRRNCKEEEWKASPDAAVALAVELSLSAKEVADVGHAMEMAPESFVDALIAAGADPDVAVEAAEAFGGDEAKERAEASIAGAPSP